MDEFAEVRNWKRQNSEKLRFRRLARMTGEAQRENGRREEVSKDHHFLLTRENF
jgi:hypothetical protein